MAKAGNRAQETEKFDKEYHWKNPDSGNSGSITLTRKYQLQDTECVETRVRISNKRKQVMDELHDYCLDEEGQWTLAGEVDK
jgi:surface antigen